MRHKAKQGRQTEINYLQYAYAEQTLYHYQVWWIWPAEGIDQEAFIDKKLGSLRPLHEKAWFMRIKWALDVSQLMLFIFRDKEWH